MLCFSRFLHNSERRRFALGATALCALPLFSRASLATTALLGGGATLPSAMYKEWGERFTTSTGLPFHYAALGSGQSLRLMTEGSANFGATEIPLGQSILERHELFQFPVAEAAIVLVANLPDITSNEIRLSPAIVSQIYLGKIRHWRDQAILALNNHITIPDLAITPVSRSDRSGSTLALSRFLNFTDVTWQQNIGLSAEAKWNYGLLAKGTSGISAVTSRTPGSIGYLVAGQRIPRSISLIALGYPELGCFMAPSTSEEIMDWPLKATTYAILRSHSSNPFDLAAFEYFRSGITDWRDLTKKTGLTPLSKSQQQYVSAIWLEHGLIKAPTS